MTHGRGCWNCWKNLPQVGCIVRVFVLGAWGRGGIGLDIGWGGVGGGAKDQTDRQNAGEVAGTGGTHHK